MFKRAFAILACLHAAWASAEPEDTLTEADYFAEQPVVLSASRLSQPVNRAPAAVTVITREMIAASGFRHLVDVLRLVPGFVVGWSGGNLPAATYLGLSDAYPHLMQIMVDGRSVYSPAFGNTTWRAIPVTLDEVDRIEVVRGPNASNDGINSLLGTIHIFTRHSALTQGKRAEVAAGEENFGEVGVRYGAETAGGNWRLSLLGRRDERHGVPQDRASDLIMSFRGDFKPGHADELMLQFGTSRGLWEGGNAGFVFNDEQHAEFLSGFANLKWARALQAHREWSLQLHHSFSQNDEAVFPPWPLDPMDANYRVSSSGLQFAYLDNAATGLRTSLAGEYRTNRGRAPSILNSDKALKDNIVRLSGAAEWPFSHHWVLHAGAMLERHDNLAGTYFSPRLALNWLPADAHSFRLGVSHGVSALGLYANNTDLYLTLNGVPVDQGVLSINEVEAEKIDSVELGYLFKQPERGLNLDARAFRNRLYDIFGVMEISFPDLDGKVLTYDNTRTIDQLGLEYQLKWQPRLQTWLAVAQSWVSNDDDQGELYSRSVPRHTLSFLGTRDVAGIAASLGYYRVSSMRWVDSGADSRYNRLDLRLAKSWKTVDARLEAALVVQALLGEEDEHFQFYKRPPFKRRAYISVKYAFR